MPKKRNVADLFRGKKPKALPGGTGKKDRHAYKTRKGITRSPLEKLYADLKKILKLKAASAIGHKKEEYFLRNFCKESTRRLYEDLVRSIDPTGSLKADEWLRQMDLRLEKYAGKEQPGRKQRLERLAERIKVAREDVGAGRTKVYERALTSETAIHKVEMAATVRHEFLNASGPITGNFSAIGDLIKKKLK